VRRVGGRGAGLVAGGQLVAGVVDGGRQAIGVERGGALAGAEPAGRDRGARPDRFRVGLPGVRGDTVAGAGRGRAGLPGHVQCGRYLGATGTVERDRLTLEAPQRLVILDRAAPGVGNPHIAGTGRLLRAVHPGEVAVLHRGLGAARVALAHLHPAVTAPLTPGAVLVFGYLVGVVVPGRGVQVVVHGRLVELVSDRVVQVDPGDNVLVEPVQGGCAAGRVVGGHAPLRVAGRRGQVAAGAVRARVRDDDLFTGLGGDHLDAPPVQRRAAIGRPVHPVGQGFCSRVED